MLNPPQAPQMEETIVKETEAYKKLKESSDRLFGTYGLLENDDPFIKDMRAMVEADTIRRAELEVCPLTAEDVDLNDIKAQYKGTPRTSKKRPMLAIRRQSHGLMYGHIGKLKDQIDTLESIVDKLKGDVREIGKTIMGDHEKIRITYPAPFERMVEFFIIKNDPFVVDNEKEFMAQTGATLDHIELTETERESEFFRHKNGHVYTPNIDMFIENRDQGHWFASTFIDGDGKWHLPDLWKRREPQAEIVDGVVRVTN